LVWREVRERSSVKKPSESKRGTLLGRLKAGIKRLWKDEQGKPAESAHHGAATGTRPRTKRDLFPDEPHETKPHRAHKPAAAKPPAHAKPKEPRGHHHEEHAARRDRPSHQRQPAERPAAERKSHERSGRQPSDRGERSAPAHDRRQRGRGSDHRRRSDTGGRAERREQGPVGPSPPPPEPPAEPAGPFPPAFESLGLPPRVLGGVRDLGYDQPTLIQEKAIPLVLEGRDVIGASQTGTGKTAAFGLPIFARLGAPAAGSRVLVLEPTRELAVQIVHAFEGLGRYTGLRTLAIYGGVGYERQRKGLHSGADILVATPGRLLDFMSDRTISLDSIEILVLDEVDRMLDMGFLPDVRRIVEQCPRQRQTLFFSATMPPQIKTLADWALREPAEVEIGIRYSPAETVSHYFYPVASSQREALLMELLEQTHYHSVMIFTRTKAQADKLYAAIKSKNYPVAVMHSDIAQRDREKALKGFREGEFEVIVATDLAARGLDISNVTHVINYQVPENPEDYVHRIGRTGRARKEGDAFTLLAADELPFAEAIERLIGQKIEQRSLEGFAYEYTALLDPQAGSADKFKKLFRSTGGTKRRKR
jgi:ATP-dependent RNA helicase RhlE